MNRPLTSAEQSLHDRFKSQLQPIANFWERCTASECQAAAEIPTPRSPAGARAARRQRAKARRDYRQRASKALYAEALRVAPPAGLGVIELAILRLVITSLLNWIMRKWANDDQDDTDTE